MTRHHALSLALVILCGLVRQGLCGMGFNVNIKASNATDTSSVSVDGYVMHVISDDEVKTFGLDGGKLPSLVEKYFGKYPTDVFLRRPALVHGVDLYTAMDWQEVSTIVNVTNSEVVSMTFQPEIVKQVTYQNNFDHNITYNSGISEQMSNTVTSSWDTGGTLTIGEKITVSVGFLGEGGKSETDFSYSQSWGIGSTHSKSVTLGSTDGVSGTLQPGDNVTVVLTASRGVMKIAVDYMAYLVGNVAVNYDTLYQQHHFWPLQAADIMANADPTNTIKSSQVLEIDFYANARTNVVQGDTGKVLPVNDVHPVTIN